jgi:hypothetical protein
MQSGTAETIPGADSAALPCCLRKLFYGFSRVKTKFITKLPGEPDRLGDLIQVWPFLLFS